MSRAHPVLRPVAGANAAARCRAIAAVDLAGSPEEVVADAQLVLTELVTNARLHGAPPVLVGVSRSGTGARVEVADAGAQPLVVPAQSADAMTGRGLAMVAAVAHAWGVESFGDGGKLVWAELRPDTTERPGPPDVDVDLVPSGPRGESDEREYPVALSQVPSELLLAVESHVDNVIRELTLAQAGSGSAAGLPVTLQDLLGAVTSAFVRVRMELKEQAAAAALRGERTVDVSLRLPGSVIEAGARYLDALDAVDSYAREGRILTLESPPLHRLFRRWYVTSLMEQVRAGVVGRTTEPTPWVDVLAREVEDLSALRGTARRLDLLQRMNAALTEAQTVEGLARTVISAAVRELGAVTARVFLDAGDRLTSVGHAAAPDPAPAEYDDVAFDAEIPSAVVFRTGVPLVVRNLAELSERYPQLTGLFASERALHVVPLRVGARRLGVLGLGFAPTSEYDETAQMQYVSALANVLAQGLSRLEATAATRPELGHRHTVTSAPSPGHLWVGGDDIERLRDLGDAAAAIAGARSVEALLEIVTEAGRAVIGTHQAAASRLHGGSWERATTHVSLSDSYARYRSFDTAPHGLGIINVVTRENRAVRFTDAELAAHPEFRGLRDAPGHPPLRHYLGVPLRNRAGRNIGLIQFSHKYDDSAFDEADEALAVQLALMVSAALEHVEVMAELETAMSRLRDEQKIVSALHDVGRAVTSRLEHAEVVQTVTDAATTLTGAQFGAFFYNVVGDSGESYALYTISGVPREAFSRFPMPRNTEIFAPTFDGLGVVRLGDVTADPRYGRAAPHHGMPAGHLPVRSYLAVPVTLSDGETIGGLFFGHADPDVFDRDAERLAVGIAGYAAIALENGRLYDAARRESRAKQQVAAALEQPLAPPELPAVTGLEIAALLEPLGSPDGLAGDFYDLLPFGDGQWLFAIGDVAGKGPEAAALTGLVRYTLWGAAQCASGPQVVAQAVNSALLRRPTDRFVTLVVGVLTPTVEGFEVEAVWAGHPPGVLTRADGVELISGEGLPLGLFPDVEATPVTFLLRPGDTVVLYTDGLLERRDVLLDEDAIVDVLREGAAAKVEDMLATTLASIADLHPARDDVALLGLRCTAVTDTTPRREPP